MLNRRVSILFALLTLGFASTGCQRRCCLDESTGSTSLVLSDKACPGGSTDLGVLSSNERDEQEAQCTDAAQALGFSGGNADGTCEQFCDLVQQACPDDTACVSSCEEFSGDNFASASAMECAEAASTCQESNACFGEL